METYRPEGRQGLHGHCHPGCHIPWLAMLPSGYLGAGAWTPGFCPHRFSGCASVSPSPALGKGLETFGGPQGTRQVGHGQDDTTKGAGLVHRTVQADAAASSQVIRSRDLALQGRERRGQPRSSQDTLTHDPLAPRKGHVCRPWHGGGEVAPTGAKATGTGQVCGDKGVTRVWAQHPTEQPLSQRATYPRTTAAAVAWGTWPHCLEANLT